MYTKYGEDYQIPAILNGELSSEKLKQKQQMAAGGTFEERFAVVNLIQGTLRETAERYENVTHQIEVLHELLLHLRNHVKKFPRMRKRGISCHRGFQRWRNLRRNRITACRLR